MILLVVEALAALLVLLLIVWWTMFSGRKRGELTGAEPAAEEARDIETFKRKEP